MVDDQNFYDFCRRWTSETSDGRYLVASAEYDDDPPRLHETIVPPLNKKSCSRSTICFQNAIHEWRQ